MKILIIHSKYKHLGGEDIVVQQETNFLKENYNVETLIFKNKKGILGAFQFLFSIWNIHTKIKLEKKIKSFKPDIIHVHNWHFGCGPIIFRIAKKYKTPIIHTVHNYRIICPSAFLLYKNQLFKASLKENFPWTAVRNKVYHNSIILTFWLAFIIWFHKKIGTWNKIDKYIFLNQFTLDIFKEAKIKLDTTKFIIKPNFCIEVNKQISIQRENYFLYIGRLSQEKGIQILIDAFKGTNFILRIAGDGPMKKEVIEAQKKSNNIKYLGMLSSSSVKEELIRAQALVFPSLWFETFGMTIIEAFSCSTPVIASSIGAPKSMITNDETGLFFNTGDSIDLQQKIKKYDSLSDKKKIIMQNNAINIFDEKYSVKNQIGYFEKIYSSIINQ